MADTQAVRFSYSVRDELGTEASELFYALVDPTATVAAMVTEWQNLAALIDPVIGAQIIRGSVAVSLLPTGGKATPDAGSRVEQTGVFNFSNAITSHRFGEALPGLSSGKIVGGKINLADVAVKALIDFIIAGSGSTIYTNAAQQVLNGVVDAVLSFRKRRRELSRSSFEVAPVGE